MTAVFGLDESDSDTFALGELRAQAEVIGALRTLVDAMVAPINEEPPITEADIHVAAEIREAGEDAEAERETDWELASCCGGLDWNCGHYGHGVFTMRDYRDKYDCWNESAWEDR